MTFNLNVRNDGAVIVFGGSGGAGSAIVRGLAKAGANVAFTYHANKRKADIIVDELQTQGAKASNYQLDITDRDATKKVVDEVLRTYGKIVGVVYASGPRWDNSLKLCDVPPDTFDFLVKSETIGFYNIINSTIGQLRENKGFVVACTTFGNQRRFLTDGQSAVPKAGIESFVRFMAYEEGPVGIRANVIGTGWHNFGHGAIDKTEAALDDPNKTMIPEGVTLESVEWMTNNIRLGNRPGRGEELANAVVFLASDQASYVTGQLLCVDGGISL